MKPTWEYGTSDLDFEQAKHYFWAFAPCTYLRKDDPEVVWKPLWFY